MALGSGEAQAVVEPGAGPLRWEVTAAQSRACGGAAHGPAGVVVTAYRCRLSALELNCRGHSNGPNERRGGLRACNGRAVEKRRGAGLLVLLQFKIGGAGKRARPWEQAWREDLLYTVGGGRGAPLLPAKEVNAPERGPPLEPGGEALGKRGREQCEVGGRIGGPSLLRERRIAGGNPWAWSPEAGGVH
ncbi:hypothetical protein NDU88_002797 [Pleurodeles waltl]|uniref:Uncharacterized protein n=1 Tax=Pleurodeles waltl TaxID=8319 RepID=A0AAV7Q854_PLEWA|nr:hypothetical protein NDU88_002797 [Pleurodeles waltl]